MPAWRVTSTDDADDQIRPAIDADTFTLPPIGEAYGVTWEELIPGENAANGREAECREKQHLARVVERQNARRLHRVVCCPFPPVPSTRNSR